MLPEKKGKANIKRLKNNFCKEEKMSEILFLEYPKCTTCQKARKWLEENGVRFKARHIVEDRPDADELKTWLAQSGKALGLKDKLPRLGEDEQIALLASDGMLVKRPLVVGKDFVLAGFREKEWQEKLI